MKHLLLTYLLLAITTCNMSAQDTLSQDSVQIDTIAIDSMLYSTIESIKEPKLRTVDPVRATWLGLVFPGGGQIYNRKYWKLPVFYGGFLGCMYALRWNGQMLRDYSQAYLDIMDDDPLTASYEKMLPLNYNIAGKEEQFKNIFRRKKDYYRKYRDMSIFAFAGVYLLSIIDAYVDAELSTFDISKDLSLNVSPAVITTHDWLSQHQGRQSYGMQLQLNY